MSPSPGVERSRSRGCGPDISIGPRKLVANGINFHRFQIAVWTLVLAIIFIKDVYENLAMPTFNTTLLGLLGLSAGTYLGLKIPEPTIPTA